MTKDEAKTELNVAWAKLDASEAVADAWVLKAAMWVIDKPWTARAIVFGGAALVLYTVYAVVKTLL